MHLSLKSVYWLFVAFGCIVRSSVMRNFSRSYATQCVWVVDLWAKKILKGNNERIKAVIMFSQVTNLTYNHPYWHGEEVHPPVPKKKASTRGWIYSQEKLDSVPTAIFPGVWVESGLVLCCFHETKWRSEQVLAWHSGFTPLHCLVFHLPGL